MALGLERFFDVLTHVTSDGDWFGTGHDGSVDRLADTLEKNPGMRAAVVGIHGYNMPDELILTVTERYPGRLVPVAGFRPDDFASMSEARRALGKLSRAGFKGIKIHPTLSDSRISSKEADWCLDACAEFGLVVFLCTIMRRRGFLPGGNPADLVYDTVVRHSEVNFILLHGGCSELLAFSDIVRGTRNTVLDLSLTIMKYAGSSLDLDIRHVLESLDRRCVVGSDFPEHEPGDVIDRLLELGAGLPSEKLENVLWRNAEALLG